MSSTEVAGGVTDPSAEAALAYPEPRRRSLQIYAVDPMIARLSGNEVVTITVPYEPLRPGPSGDLVQVIDYDASTKRFYTPVDLDSPVLLAQDGLAPSERDPRFHQQMVYAVTSSLLENFERGLGRRFRWRGSDRLRIFPHGFQGENAVFDDGHGGSLRFGYFRTDPRDAGRNLPGQWVFSCLSHDIVVHEATHALVDRLRPLYKEATNIDVYAFHEGFADVVALFQHFALPELLARYIQSNRADLTARSPLVELAQQFGESTGRGRALRDALGEENPDPTRLGRTLEPHARGSIFVSAVFDAFFTTYQAAIADLIRIATAGSGQLPPGALHPDLVARVAGEARAMAQRVLMMCIRAFQYLPPVDVTFGDFLRSAVTADVDLFPADTLGLRAALVEGFRKRGIYPDGVSGLADEAVAWPSAAELGLPPLDVVAVVEPLVAETALGFRTRRSARRGHRRAAGPAEGRGQGPQRLRPQARRRPRTESPAEDPGAQLPRRVPTGRERSGQGQRGRADHPDRPGRGVEGPRRRRGPAPRRTDPGRGCGRRGPVRGRPPDTGSGSGRGSGRRGAVGGPRCLRRPVRRRGPAGSVADRRPERRLPVAGVPTRTGPADRGLAHPRSAGSGPAVVTATLRMYAVGFGDCFLLTVPRFEERPWRMLVDCGVHGMGRGEHSLGTVITDLIATCSDGPGGGPIIDLVVASHRHQDHIAGFTDARWGDVTVGEVWLPWCEDPADTEAQRLRTRLDGAARTLHQQFAVDAPEVAAIALNSLSNERAMTTLRDGFAGQPTRRFQSATAPVRTELAGLPDARIHLLGPARSEEAIKAMDPPELERWLALSLGVGPGATVPGGPDPATGPFGPAYGITDRAVFRQRYPHLDADDDLLDHAVLDPDDALAAASWLDRCLNNTSLVFVVEIEDVRIVFPGDAQWGVWREILTNTDARALLERATLYKVSHHGSHNGSPKSLVHDVLPEHVTSMMSFRTMERWTAIPQTDLVAALRTPGRTLLRPDEDIPAAGPGGVGEIRRAADGLWTEIDLG